MIPEPVPTRTRPAPTPKSWRVAYVLLLAITLAWIVALGLWGSTALSWLAGLFGGAL